MAHTIHCDLSSLLKTFIKQVVQEIVWHSDLSDVTKHNHDIVWAQSGPVTIYRVVQKSLTKERRLRDGEGLT